MRLNIHYKITFLILSIVAVILAGVYFYLNKNLTEYSQQQIEEQLQKDIQLARIYFESQYRFNLSVEDVDKIVDVIAEKLKVQVLVADREGNVIGDSEATAAQIKSMDKKIYQYEVAALLLSKDKNPKAVIDTPRDLISASSVFGKEALLGIIRLSLPLTSMKSFSQNLRHMLFMALLAAFIFSIVFSFMASNFISNPIKEISRVAQSISSGDFSKRLSANSNDEIGALARALNHMSEQIKMRIGEVISSKSRLEAVFLSMIEGVVVFDHDGSILLMNQTLRQLLHIAQDPSGRKPLEIIRNIEIQEVVDSVLKYQKGTMSREVTLFSPEERVLLIHAAPVIREDKIDGAVLIFHDITELRQLEKVRRDFVANVSHELRTPVATIKGYAETLLSGAIDDKENVLDFLKIIHTDSDRLAKLINDLLDLSRIESGKLNIHPKPVAIVPLIERVMASLAPSLKEKLLIFRVEIPPECSKILIDENSAAQIFFNLIENAIKYNKMGGKVVIAAQRLDSQVEVSIHDTGLGIPEKDLPRIFERFYRVDKAHSRQIGGTGLGLSIVKHLVQVNNGAIRVDSVPTQGSTFILSFPHA